MNTSGLILLLLCAQAYGQREKLEAFVTKAIKGISSILPDNPQNTTEVHLGLMLQNIVDYDPHQQVLETTGYFINRWTQPSLKWNPADFGNITTLSFPCDDIAKPDIKLYNGVRHGMHVEDDDINCVVSSSGEISYIPIVAIESFCENNDPGQDRFYCHLHFGSWTHPCKDIKIANDKNMLDLSTFEAGWRWNILNHTAYTRAVHYDCCPESYCKLDIEMEIQDKSRAPAGTHYHH